MITQWTRTALHRCAPALAVLFLSGCQAPASSRLNDDTAYAKLVGLAITKQPGWRFASRAEMLDQQRSFDSGNSRLNQMVRHSGDDVFVIIQRTDRVLSAFQPSITVSRYVRDEDRLAPSIKVAGFLIANHREVLRDVRVLEEPRLTKVGGADFATCRIRFPVTSRSGASFEVETRFWVRADPASAAVVSASCDTRDASVLEPEILNTINSIQVR